MVNLRHSLLFEMGYLNKRTKYVKQWVSDIGYQCRTMIPETGGETNKVSHCLLTTWSNQEQLGSLPEFRR